MIVKKWFTLVYVVCVVFSGNGATVCGTIIDSVCGKPVVDAKVLLRDRGAKAIDSSKSNNYGHYSICNVAAGNYSLVVSALRDYRLETVDLTVGTASVTKDIMLSIAETGTLRGISSSASTLEIFVSKTGLLFRNFSETGIVSIYSASGKLLYRNELAANTRSLDLPQYIIAHGVYLVKINLNGKTFGQQIIMR